ncbi:MAG: N-acetylmuramoyl-L-alanine amidase [Gordonia sp. (in: high G+C Gram-positive bacteria)]
MRLFRLGDQGPAVAEIRSILAGQGLLPAPRGRHAATPARSDLFDEDTDHAVRAFQQQRRLMVDGVVGPATYRALRESSYQLGARVLSFRLSAPMAGDDVVTLQSRLQNLGYYTRLVDGVFGEATHEALCTYQSEYGLSPDGICGPNTLRSLEYLGTRINGGSPHAIREQEHVRRSGPQLSGKRIIIDPGTGGKTLPPQLAETERRLLWDLAARLEGRMGAAGMEAFLSHDGRGAPDDNDRAGVANMIDADLMIALRCGHYRNSKANGVASFYFGNSHGSYSSIGRNLCSFIQREIVARTPLTDCQVHGRTWELLRLTTMPVVIIDIGYITNPDDAALLSDPHYRNTIADAILVAVKRLYLLDQDDRPTGTYTFNDLLAAEHS